MRLSLTVSLFAITLGAAISGFAMAQTGPDADGREWAALTSQSETTVARRLLMVSIGANNDTVHDLLDGVLPMDEYELRTRLTSISHMLYAFPNLYRSEPNPWTKAEEDADPARVSLSTPAVWENFEQFKAMADQAYRLAQEAADAPHDQVLGLVEQLETLCESCHATYRTELKFLDYDNLEKSLLP